MQQALASRFRRIFVELWLGATTVLLLLATAASLRSPALLVHIGLFDASGLAAICGTALPAVCGIAALLGLFQNRASAPVLLLLYSLYWLVLLVGGMLAAALHSTAAEIARITWHGWLVGGVMFATMIACFLVLTLWSIRHLPGRAARVSGS